MGILGDFLKLVQNENMKIYRRLRTWIMFGLTALLTIMFGVLFSLEGGSTVLSAWDVISQLFFLYFLATIFSVIVASDIVAGEFTWGTIKLLLIRPWTRTKVLLSKLIAVLLFTIALTVVFMIAAMAISFLLFHKESSDIFAQGDSPLRYIMESLLYKYIDLVVITVFSFMISTVFRSGGIAIGLSMFILFTGNIFTMLFSPARYSWAKYVLFVNMDLGQYMGQGAITPAAGMSLAFSSWILAAYVLLFLVISWIVFKKRDVAA
ncbi:ABC transporter permease [Paenibacillus sp. FSL K6-2524]|uniref:ABC transporter permease n=1 Tax=Paenibacillus sp. FSL K6-2524 TaxID=2954516 RepID=UPI0030F73B51